jgi:hypothetical protein
MNFAPFAFRQEVATGPAPFNPNNLTDLTFWIDFSNSSFYETSGSNITNVFSLVGGTTGHTLARVNTSNGFYTLTASLSNPSLNSAKVTTRPTSYRASSWNTADNNAIVFGPKTDTTSYPDGSMFIVYNRGTISTAGYLISRYNNSTDRGVQYNLATGSPNTDIIGYDFNSPAYQYYNTNNSANVILGRVNTGTTSTIYTNGIIQVSGAKNDTQARIFRQFHNLGIFGSPTATGDSTPVNTQYCEIIIYNRVLTESEINQVTQYLANKWTITLPTPDIVRNTLTLNYDAGNKNSYLGTGTSWSSAVGNINTFTLTNGPTFSTNNGGTIVFDGTNDYTTRAAQADFEFGTGDFTIECWVRIAANSSTNNDGDRFATLVSAFPTSGAGLASSYNLSIRGNTTTTGIGLSFGCRDASSNSQFATMDYTFSTGVFYQVGITRIGATTNFFVNGQLYAASINITNNITISTRPLNFARLGYSGYLQYLNGTMGIVRIYKGKGLTSSEVLQNYNANSNRI